MNSRFIRLLLCQLVVCPSLQLKPKIFKRNLLVNAHTCNHIDMTRMHTCEENLRQWKKAERNEEKRARLSPHIDIFVLCAHTIKVNETHAHAQSECIRQCLNHTWIVHFIFHSVFFFIFSCSVVRSLVHFVRSSVLYVSRMVANACLVRCHEWNDASKWDATTSKSTARATSSDTLSNAHTMKLKKYKKKNEKEEK